MKILQLDVFLKVLRLSNTPCTTKGLFFTIFLPKIIKKFKGLTSHSPPIKLLDFRHLLTNRHSLKILLPMNSNENVDKIHFITIIPTFSANGPLGHLKIGTAL